jgi:hypothetical protein
VRRAAIAAGILLVVTGGALVVSAGSGSWTVHGGPSEGWTVAVPPGWNAQVFDGDRCEFRGYRSAVILTNADFSFQGPRPDDPEECFGRFILAGFPRDRVALALQPYGHRFGLLFPTCIHPPVERSALTNGRFDGGPSKVRYGDICPGSREDGPAYSVRVWIGRAAPASAVAELDRALASFRFLRGFVDDEA